MRLMRSFWVVIVLTISSLFVYGNGSRAAAQSANEGSAVASGPHEMPNDRWVRERVELLSLEGPPEAERAVHSLAARATVILPQVESALGVRPARLYRIVLVPALGLSDSTLARMDQSAPEWAAGYMIPQQRIGAIRITRAAQYPYGTLESVLAHEATHLLLYDAAPGRLPLWFEEGVATWEGRHWTAEDMWIYARGLLTSDLPHLAELDSLFHATAAEAELAYAGSFAFVSWNVHRHGADLLPRVIEGARSRPFAAAWLAATGEPLDRAEAAWRRDSLIRYRWLPLLTASSTIWGLLALLAAWAGMVRRARARAARERWRELEEAAPESEES
jgi:hypothetical protein